MAEQKTSLPSIAAVVLAAGKGKRLDSARPKVLHPVAGRPSLWHVLRAAGSAGPSKTIVVVSRGADAVREAVRSWGIRPEPVFVDQGEPLGTGHAVLVAEKEIGRVDEVLVLAGDDPLVEAHHVRELLRVHRRTKAAATLLTTLVDDPGGYARVVRDGTRLVDIVEEVEASPHIRAIREMATVVFAFRREDLFRALPAVGRENRQREYYLHHVVPILQNKGERVSAKLADFGGWAGVNSRATIARCDRILRDRINARHLAKGVTIVDPSATYIDVGVRIGRETRVLPNTYLHGDTRIGTGCTIGPSAQIVDGTIGDRSSVRFSVVERAKVGRDVEVGPFARLRPGTVLADGSNVGSYVEVKGSRIGPGSKVPHLSYVGDAEIGRGVNVGAGSVTVNYDGYGKNRTVIGDGARIGSDTMLVAPVKIGKGAVTGAGSVITKDVPAGALAVERSEQHVLKGYRKRKDEEHRREKG